MNFFFFLSNRSKRNSISCLMKLYHTT
jgi:hypothetical protein